jgi:hypothetical protein
VALDEEGKPTAVPQLRPETPVELRRAREAQLRREHRLAERERIEAARGTGPPAHIVASGGGSSGGS